MPKLVDLELIRTQATTAATHAVQRFRRYEASTPRLDDMRWHACMTLVELHAVWERFAERRLVAALNNHPLFFLAENGVKGITKIPFGLAEQIARGGDRYFDFRQCSNLIDKTDKLVSRDQNPFARIATNLRNHIDAMSAIRNVVVHQSDASQVSYRKYLRTIFNIAAAPSAGEFLDSIDRRAHSPHPKLKRVLVFANVVSTVVAKT